MLCKELRSSNNLYMFSFPSLIEVFIENKLKINELESSIKILFKSFVNKNYSFDFSSLLFLLNTIFQIFENNY